MNKPIADLHCHPSLKPANNEKIEDIWTYKKNLTTKRLFKGLFGLGISPRKWAVNIFVRDMATYTQTNLDSCYEGNNRLLFFAIYPPERPFLRPDRPFKGATPKQRFLLNRIFGKKLKRNVDNKIIRLLTGFSTQRTKAYLDSIYKAQEVDYFEDYIKEYDYILKSNGTFSTNDKYIFKPTLRLVKNYEEYQELIEKNEIAGILTAEGMHAFAAYNGNDLFTKKSIEQLSDDNRTSLEKSFIENINKLKNPDEFEFPPIFVTFSHHFNNLIAGHANTFADSKIRTIPGFSDVFNQQNGLDEGITAFGKTLLRDHLFSRENGPRILVDTKHMSLKTRTDFVEIVKQFKKNGDNIPIICSHTAINGIPTREKAAARADTNRLDENSYVSRWDINVTDEDLIEIYDTEGVVGICMHDGRMPGGKFKKLLKGFKRGIEQTESIKRLHAQMFLTNIFHVARINLNHIRELNKKQALAIPENSAWDTICLGSDSDGIVDPFDHYNTADRLDDFKHRIAKAIKLNFLPTMEKFRIICVDEDDCRFYTLEEINDIMQGFTPEEIADKVFSDNIVTFLSKFFTKKYLHG